MLRLSGHRRMLVPVIVLVLILPAIGGILALFSNLHQLRLRYIGRAYPHCASYTIHPEYPFYPWLKFLMILYFN